MKKIWIISHVEKEGLGLIPEILDELDLEYKHISLAEGDDLPVLADVRGVISMGGSMSAYQTDEFSFIHDEMSFVKKLVKDDIPFLGICLGAQICAQAFGAKVSPAKMEMGWLLLKKTPEAESDSVLKDLEIPLMFQLHWDVFETPVDAVCLAVSDGNDNQAFRFGKNAYAFQFHPETNQARLEYAFDGYKDKVSAEKFEEAMRGVDDKINMGKEFLKKFLNKLFG